MRYIKKNYLAFNLLGEFLHPALDFKMIAATLGSDCIPSRSSSVWFFFLQSAHPRIPARGVPDTIPGCRDPCLGAFTPKRGGCCRARLHSGCAHLWAAVFASSTPPPCIQLRTAFMPPSGSSFRLLPLLWMLSWIPNIKKRKKAPLIWVHVMSFCFSASPPA